MTSYEDIYDLNQGIMTDNRLSALPDNIYYFTLNVYLDFARAMFMADCYHDLSDIVAFSQEYYTFTGDNTTVDFTLSPAPPTDAEIYVSINGVETTAFSFNSTTDVVTFDSAPADEAEIYVGAYVIGSFAEDLNIEEKRILAEAMTIPFIESYLNTTKALNQLIYARGSGMHSQGSHNRVLSDRVDKQYQRVHQMIVNYTYRYDPDDLADLASMSTL